MLQFYVSLVIEVILSNTAQNMDMHTHTAAAVYRSVPSKHPLPGKRPCTTFQGATVAASIQMYGILIPGKHPCEPKSRVMLWALTRSGHYGAIVYVQLP